LEEGFGTHASSHETVCQWVKAIKKAGKRRTTPLAVEPQHRWWMNATWNKWNLSLNIHTVSFEQGWIQSCI